MKVLKIVSGPQGLQPADPWSRQSRRHGKNASRGHVLGIVLFWLLLAAPAIHAAADPGTITSFAAAGTSACADGICTMGNYTVNSTDGAIHIAVLGRFNTSAAVANTLVCTLGGESHSYKSVRSLNDGTIGFQFLFLSDKLVSMGTGSQALVCSATGETATSTTGVMAQVRHFTGVAQQVATKENGDNFANGGTTVSADLTGVVAGSIVCWTTAASANPGTWISPTADSETTGMLSTRWQRTGCVVSEAGGSVGVDPTWTNAASTSAVSVAFEPAPDEDVQPPVITVVQPWPFVPPPPETLTIDNDSTLSAATETVAYSVNMATMGGTAPKDFRIEGGEDAR